MDIAVIDCNAISYMAHFTTASMSRSDGTPTGVVWGFFHQLKSIVEQTQCVHLVFAWDSKESKRKKLFPEYKSNRAKNREEDPTINDAFFQFDELHEVILPRLGFTNNWKVVGYEADDIIAQVCKYKEKGWKITIVSNDQDLYQLLGGGVRMYKPTKGVFYTAQDFRDEHMGLCPEHWATVKALAGCPGDGVPGIRGVGEKTVVKYLTRAEGHKKIDTPEGHKIWNRNLPLVQLPFEGLFMPDIVFPDMVYQNWKEFCMEYEFQSFLNKPQFWKDLFQYKAPEGFFMPLAKSQRHRGRR